MRDWILILVLFFFTMINGAGLWEIFQSREMYKERCNINVRNGNELKTWYVPCQVVTVPMTTIEDDK